MTDEPQGPHEQRDDIVDALRALPPIEPPDKLVRATLAAVEKARSSRRFAIGLFLVTAAVALLAFLGIQLSRTETDAGPTMADGSTPKGFSLSGAEAGANQPAAPPVSSISTATEDRREKAGKLGGKGKDQGEIGGEGEDIANLEAEIVNGVDDLPKRDFHWRGPAGDKPDNDHDGVLDGWDTVVAGQQGQMGDGQYQVELDGKRVTEKATVVHGDVAGAVDPATIVVDGSEVLHLAQEGYFARERTIAGLTDLDEEKEKEKPEETKTSGTTGLGPAFELSANANTQTPPTDVGGTFAVELPRGEATEFVPELGKEVTTRDEATRVDNLANKVEPASGFEDGDGRDDDRAQNFRDTTVAGGRDSGIDANGDMGRYRGMTWPPAVAVEARGYWADTYVPGDPELAWLRQSLTNIPMAGERIALEEQAHEVAQPFDAPRTEAIGLTLSSDTPAIAGPTRMTLQIGIAGAKQGPTRRSALDVAVVIDVASVVGKDDDRRLLWSIADTLVAERQAGDRFAIVVPKSDGVVVLKGDTLSATEVVRVLSESLAAPSDDLASALNSAYQTVHADSTAASEQTIGAQGVVLVSARSIDASAYAGRAHDEALRDVRLSVIGVGGHTDGSALGDLARAGQGRRWLASDAPSARRALQDELSAAGKAVARAIRLRVRLAPDVKFYGILGSQRLDETRAAQTKAAEKAIDDKLAETMGVKADRGDDEDGIQIVIPAFMAGDTHVILLDVEVQKPGPVLDVRARWKDLVRVGNGEAQASLAIGQLSGESRTLPPAARNVRENRVAILVGNALVAAGRALEQGNPAHAQALLAEATRLVSPYAGLAETKDELSLLAAYVELVARDPMNDVTARSLGVSGRTLR